LKKPFLPFLVFMSIILIGCTQSPSNNNPGWVNNLVATYEKDPVGNPPQSIWQYDFKGQTVYYVPAQCCDQFSTLYNALGEIICAPDGGFTGHGDGRCPDFFQVRGNGKLIWQDSRTR
jgi:hypothetical protein